MRSDKPSQETLNAFVDGEFCPEERLACLKQFSDDEALSREVCDLCQVKEMVNLAYERVPPPPQRPASARRAGRGWRGSVAATAVVMAVAGATWMGIGAREPDGRITVSEVGQGQRVPERSANRIVLHLTTADPERVTNILDEVEVLMEAAVRQGLPLQIQVVANGEGLALMREDISPFPQRVSMLSARYADRLRFTACLNTIERLRLDKNIHVRLLPAVHVIDSGVVEVIRRQSQGWTYIQV